MTPSNPDNNQPLIYRICDALGVFHIVAPVDHHHSQAEIDGLAAALTAKANAVHTHTQSEIDGLQLALMNKADANRTEIELNKKIDKVQSATSGDIAVFDIDGGVEDSGTKMSNLQPKLTFDTIPIAGSTNPVTSGGVKVALDDKQDTLTFDSTPTTGSTNPVTSGGVKTALDNKSSIGNAYMDSKVEVEIKHIGDDEYDQAKVIGGNRIFLGVGADAEDGEATIDANNITNLQRALLNPDSTPTANSNNLVTSGGVKTALDSKAPILDTQVVFLTWDNTDIIYLPDYFANGENQRTLLIHIGESEADILDMFASNLIDKSNIRILTANDTPSFSVYDCYLSLRVFRQPNGISTGIEAYYIIIDGILSY